MLFWIFVVNIYILQIQYKSNIFTFVIIIKLYLYEYNRLYEYEIILFEIMIVYNRLNLAHLAL